MGFGFGRSGIKKSGGGTGETVYVDKTYDLTLSTNPIGTFTS